MAHDALTLALRTARREQQLTLAVGAAETGLAVAGAAALVLAAVHVLWFHVPWLATCVILASPPILSLCVTLVRRWPTMALAARAADVKLDTDDLLTTAWYLKTRAFAGDAANAQRVTQLAADVCRDRGHELSTRHLTHRAFTPFVAFAIAAALFPLANNRGTPLLGLPAQPISLVTATALPGAPATLATATQSTDPASPLQPALARSISPDVPGASRESPGDTARIGAGAPFVAASAAAPGLPAGIRAPDGAASGASTSGEPQAGTDAPGARATGEETAPVGHVPPAPVSVPLIRRATAAADGLAGKGIELENAAILPAAARTATTPAAPAQLINFNTQAGASSPALRAWVIAFREARADAR